MSKPDDFMSRLTRYMTDVMGYRKTAADQNENWTMRHMAQFAEMERRRIHREIARALAHFRGRDFPECCKDAVAAIDAALQAPRRRGR